MNKDDNQKNNNQHNPTDKEQVEMKDLPTTDTTPVDDEDYVATAEEMEAFIKSRREKHQADKRGGRNGDSYDKDPS